ncbi:MAG TPA: molybdopterin cofactor-binding domain-containing protein [Candidatus Acidoferrales bacterium]|nr:molybdopterin cofactor-binding domain-containing protein [Candidatus Acidoferrales bacterium]
MKRRKFLQSAGTLTIGFSWWGTSFLPPLTLDGEYDTDSAPGAASLDSWLAVGSDGTVTVLTSKVDLGTGVLTALSQVVAEELDVSFHRVRMFTGDTDHTIDQSQTSGSRTLHKAGPQLRQAAAAARRELVRRASVRLGLAPKNLNVEDGNVSAPGGESKTISYWELIGNKRFHLTMTATGTGENLQLAPDVPPKNLKDYKIVGTSVPRIDLPAKFSGEFVYTQDVRMPGMLHGRVIRPNHPISLPTGVDETSIRDIPGIVAVVRKESFVGVVATTEWSAIRAANNLKVKWSEPVVKLPANDDAAFAYLRDTKTFHDQVVVDKGNVQWGQSPAQQASTFAATYRWPFQMHGMIGPSCAVADVGPKTACVWTASQGIFRTRKAVADLLGFAEKDVRIVYVEGSGCYGRMCPDDAAEDAAVLSREVGKPVRVQWMRRDEHIWEPKGSAQFLNVRAKVDTQGRILAWDFMDRFHPYTAGVDNRLLAARQIGLEQTGPGALGHGFNYGKAGGGDLYAFEQQRIISPAIPWIQNDLTPLRTCNLRAPGTVARTFASECFIDEIAAHLATDPVQYRLSLRVNDPRTHGVLKAAAAKAEWMTRPSPLPPSGEFTARGRGVACSNREGTIVAAIAEIEVDKKTGKISVRRITVAQDCGLIANPDGVKNQIEGNVLQGISRTLFEEVQFDESGLRTVDWASYRTLRFEDLPEVEIVLINRPDFGFLGVGEAAVIPIPAAIANALFDAAGIRLRQVPLTPERVKSTLPS